MGLNCEYRVNCDFCICCSLKRERETEFKRKKRIGCIKKYNKRNVYTKSERDGEFERKESRVHKEIQ